MTNVLDVRAKYTTLKKIRAMAGRAMLDGPHDYNVIDLEGPLLDLAVSKAEGMKAVIYKVDNAIAPFFECCVLSEDGRLHYQYLPSRDWTSGGPLIERECIGVVPPSNAEGWAAAYHESAFSYGVTPLLAAMRCYVVKKLGATVRM